MAVGDLSAAQLEYLGRIRAGTGLDKNVLTAWIGQESGWNTTKTGHNYLNIGPGRNYPSVAAAGQAVVQLLQNDRYAPIRQAVPRGPIPQLDAIVQSPWDADRYNMSTGPDGSITSRLHVIYRQLVPSAGVEGSVDVGNPGLVDGVTGAVSGVVGGIAGAIGNSFGLSGLGEDLLVVGLYVAFTFTALGLIFLALWRLTKPARDVAVDAATLALTKGKK